MGVGQRVQTVTLPAERGSIFDRNGVDLALSVPQTTIVADPHVIHDPKAFAAKLAPVAVVNEAELEAKLSQPKSRFAYVARKVDDATVARVKKLDLNGLSYIPESKRFYPSGLLAAPVLGFVGTDDYGLAGLESFYEKSLKGRAGEARIERDPQGNEIPGGADVVKPAVRGKDIVLTIDQSIQASAEHTLTQQVEDAGRQGRHGDRGRRPHRRHPRDGHRQRRRPTGARPARRRRRTRTSPRPRSTSRGRPTRSSRWPARSRTASSRPRP